MRIGRMNVCFQIFLSYHFLDLVSDNGYYVILFDFAGLILLCFGKDLSRNRENYLRTYCRWFDRGYFSS